MFETALEFVLGWEGGLSDHPDDPGGLTHHGITHGTLERWRGQALDPEETRNLTLQEAGAIYRKEYWDQCSCDALPDPVALLVFDCAVNQGPGAAARILQSALGVTVDGAIGPQTLGAAGQADVDSLVDEIVALRAVRYAHTEKPMFYKGWFRRLTAAHRAAIEL